MAFDIPQIEPREAVCGDRFQWTRSFDDFSAAEWTLTYRLLGKKAGSTIDITAVASGGDFSIDVAPEVTAEYTDDVYYWSAFASKTGDRKLVAQGRMVLKPDPAGEFAEGKDGRSHARKVLEAIEAVIERRSLTDIQRYTLQAVGRNVDRSPISDLLKLRDYYVGLVKAEEAQEAINRGESNGDLVLARFRAPR